MRLTAPIQLSLVVISNCRYAGGPRPPCQALFLGKPQRDIGRIDLSFRKVQDKL